MVMRVREWDLVVVEWFQSNCGQVIHLTTIGKRLYEVGLGVSGVVGKGYMRISRLKWSD